MIEGLNAKGCCDVGFACSRSADKGVILHLVHEIT